jgi:hypothetical protein
MTLLDSYLSGTQFIGSIANYWHIFVMFLVLIILLFVFHSSIKVTDWPPPCDEDGNPPKESSSCSIPKSRFLLILGGIILVLIASIYFSWAFRDNKTFQTVQGVGTEGDILSRLF